MQDQGDILAFLEKPQTHGGASVTRIDTHSASVFLAGNRVLKVKRAVKFPFLDYTTLDNRRAACEAEIAANQPFAPQIYRGVAVITCAADGALALGGDGEPVEYAVDMTRFDETRTLDKLPLAPLQRNFPNGFPIPVGEKLEYEVRFSRFPIYATVGIVTFEFLGETKFNHTEGNGSAECPDAHAGEQKLPRTFANHAGRGFEAKRLPHRAHREVASRLGMAGAAGAAPALHAKERRLAGGHRRASRGVGILLCQTHRRRPRHSRL